jgi:hypothetical protein
MVAKLKAKLIPKDYQINIFQETTKPEIEGFDSKRVHIRVL